MEQEEWMTNIKQHGWTVKDVTELKHGAEIKLLVLDRNVSDITTQANTKNVVCAPTVFFRKNWAIYRHNSGLQGELSFSFEEGKFQPFEFELLLPLNAHPEQKERWWYPLKYQHMPAKDEQGIAKFDLGVAKHFSSFPNTTPVGWRGHMIPWDKIVIASDVYWSPL